MRARASSSPSICSGAGMLSLLIGVLLLGGCATPATQMGMTVATPQTGLLRPIPERLRGQVAVKDVMGGSETNPMLVSNISSSDFETALEASLRNVGLGAANRQSGRYLVGATLIKVDKPLFGASLTVTTTVNYDLIERSSNKTVWTKTITKDYTAQFSDAFLGAERLRLANEGSARANISAFIDELSASAPE
jgi:hypothetical protein